MRLAPRLTLWLLAVVGLVLSADAYLGIRQHIKFFEADLRRDERRLGRALAHAVERFWIEEGEQAALALVQGADDPQSAVRIRLVHLDAEAGSEFAPDVPERERAAVARARGITHVRDDDEGLRFYTYVPLDVPQAPRSALEISESIRTEQEFLNDQIRSRVVTVAILFATCALVAWAAGARIVGRPIQRLVDKARRIGAGDFSEPLALPPRDELSMARRRDERDGRGPGGERARSRRRVGRARRRRSSSSATPTASPRSASWPPGWPTSSARRST